MSERDQRAGEAQNARAETDEEPDGDHFLLDEHDGGDEAAGALELDDAQSKEIRQIFLTSLPQYLEPVDQMIEQLLSEEGSETETRKALLTTISSIAEAAGRLGIDDVRAVLERMHEHVSLSGEDGASPGGEFEEGIRAALREIRTIAEGPSPQGPPDKRGERSRTIVAALREAKDVDKSVLEKLTAAGLVTVDQLRMADPQEIVAVTGLDAGTVDGLLRALVHGEDSARPPPADASTTGAVEDPPRSDSLDAMLERKVRAQVEAEASLEEIRPKLGRLRVQSEALLDDLRSAERRRDELRRELLASADRVAEGLAALNEARARREGIRTRKAASEHALQQCAGRIQQLERERAALIDEHRQFLKHLEELSGRVRQMLDATPTDRPEHAARTHRASGRGIIRRDT